MGLTLRKLYPSCISEIIIVMLRIISDIPLFLSLIGFLCVFPRLSIGWSCVPLPCLQACGWLWVLAAAFIASAGYWYFPSTPRASPDDGPLPLVFYGFCDSYGHFPFVLDGL